ncbi:MGMT family protein [Streptomyces ramulosus]|uniref:MGMT family protein n=1 Tax=Streptomyces ramulosus TaxID=47762 RepID=A0ABW1FGT0_9ACTN
MSGHRDGTAPDTSEDDGPAPQGARPAPELPDYAERVLGMAERIPPGHVLTYGDVAARLAAEDRDGRGGGPRQVGRAMALYGGAVPWWRVVRADGALLPGSERRALAHYRAEGTPLRTAADGSAARLDMRRARWDGPLGPAADCEVSDTAPGARHVVDLTHLPGIPEGALPTGAAGHDSGDGPLPGAPAAGRGRGGGRTAPDGPAPRGRRRGRGPPAHS